MASAFLPLSIAHLPEFSQKNVMGIVLLAVFLLLVKKSFDSFSMGRIFVLVLLFVLITLTHLGTTGATILYGLSVLTAFVVNKKNILTILKTAIIGMVASGFALTVIRLIDQQRFDRIVFYMNRSLDSSFIGSIISTEVEASQKLLAFAGIVVPILVIAYLILVFRRYSDPLSESDRLFWLSNILFCYFLVLPIYDQLLLARFFIFLSLPLLVVIVYTLRYSAWSAWIKQCTVAAVSLGILILAFGEIMSVQMHEKNKDEVLKEMVEMKEQIRFDSNDLIITKNGAEHICNWFLGTKAGLIPTLNRKDFGRYNTVYILNPIQGQLNFENIENKRADNETDRYIFMMRNIPKPKNAITVFKTENIELLRIDSAPSEWEYNSSGYWMSYGKMSTWK